MSLLGASGLKPKGAVPLKPSTPAPEPTAEPGEKNISLAAGEREQLDQTGLTSPGGTLGGDTKEGAGVKEPRSDAVGTVGGDADVAPAQARRRKPARTETQAQTLYFGEGEIERAADVAHYLKKSGRFKGLVRGHVGVSLAMRTALDLLLEEHHRDPAATLDRALRVAARGVR